MITDYLYAFISFSFKDNILFECLKYKLKLNFVDLTEEVNEFIE